MGHVVKCLPSKHEALSSNPGSTKKKKKIKRILAVVLSISFNLFSRFLDQIHVSQMLSLNSQSIMNFNLIKTSGWLALVLAPVAHSPQLPEKWTY
jgi:hypothetical protein